jgi:hypothetical protein
MPRESFKVELIFDDVTGDLVDVVAIEGVGSKHGDKVEIRKLSEASLNKATSHSLLFAWGSPGWWRPAGLSCWPALSSWR